MSAGDTPNQSPFIGNSLRTDREFRAVYDAVAARLLDSQPRTRHDRDDLQLPGWLSRRSGAGAGSDAKFTRRSALREYRLSVAAPHHPHTRSAARRTLGCKRLALH